MRSQTIAAPVAQSTFSHNRLALLTFKVGEQEYSLPVSRVIRIIEMVTITRLPGVPNVIQGVINLRGKMAPVVDLRHRFGLPPHAYGLHTPIILADPGGHNGSHLGLIVDSVEQVLDVAPEDLEQLEAIVPAEWVAHTSAAAAYLAGVAKVERRIILLLEVQALLNLNERQQLAQALGQNPQK